jgi:hypothetical protein
MDTWKQSVCFAHPISDNDQRHLFRYQNDTGSWVEQSMQMTQGTFRMLSVAVDSWNRRMQRLYFAFSWTWDLQNDLLDQRLTLKRLRPSVTDRCDGQYQPAVDYRSEDGCYPVSGSWVTISNPNSLSSSETGVYPGIRSWKGSYIWKSLMSESHWWIYFTKIWIRTDDTPQACLTFDSYFKHGLRTYGNLAPCSDTNRSCPWF